MVAMHRRFVKKIRQFAAVLARPSSDKESIELDRLCRVLHAERIVLQLPAIGPASRWLPTYVADNYRHNGFRLALTAVRLKDAIDLVGQFRPHAIALDARALRNAALLSQLLILAQASKIVATIKKVETAETLALLGQVCRATGTVVHAQGNWIARPQPLLQRRYVNPIELATASIA
jgi:EAL domain-containing protein (putative c-di-GMP-specific phosphodiesterase class I)